MTCIHKGNNWKPVKIFPDDIKLLIECFKEHDRLMAEANKLSDKALAEKFVVSPQRINKIRIDYLGRVR